ncbi:MAG: SUF system NifU family Fe-S cluster assembly protein [Candidatus Aminicenantes bacterium]|nr:SUF system NifU family Fe-S cluster assembly protein [Candidatus Aminicenantes bacterium]
MKADLKELYQEIILDHNKNPRNFKKLDRHTHKAEGYNPLCGDHYTLYLKVENDKILDVSFEGAGCAISKSSASLMTSCIKGKSRAEAEEIFRNFHLMLTGNLEPGDLPGSMCKMEALQGVKAFPTRIKCATLVWHTMKSALDGKQEAGTEQGAAHPAHNR